ncbi:MAG: sigma-54 dependent transcriptional regulator [Pirellulales bacterium]
MRVLFADDEPTIQELMRIELPRLGYETTVCPDGQTALAALDQTAYDCVIVDLDMPGAGGMEVITHMCESSPDTESVIITGKSSLESAIKAVKQGVFEYLTKPCKLAEIQSVLERVREKRELTAKLRALENRLRRAEGPNAMVGNSPALEKVRQLIAKVAPSESNVLIRGETGVGKELVARSVHDLSTRANCPLVAVNCGSLPEHLVESELFGHRKGAFTGADEHRPGLFEVANGGTLFLDEIGELPKSLQPRLLRVLESGEIRRVGENQTHHVDVRLVCATHRSLEEMVTNEGFREDLLFRINTFEIIVPPLRSRREDIPELVQHFLRKSRPHIPQKTDVVTQEVLNILNAHHWPGNVRELANVVEHALVLCDEFPLCTDHLPSRLETLSEISAGTQRTEPHHKPTRPESLREMEMRAIVEGLDRNNGNKARTADELGISLKTLYNKLNQLQELSHEQ